MKASSESGECASLISITCVVACLVGIIRPETEWLAFRRVRCKARRRPQTSGFSPLLRGFLPRETFQETLPQRGAERLAKPVSFQVQKTNTLERYRQFAAGRAAKE